MGFDVELLDPEGGPENVQRVAEGEADFCLTSVAHYLTARHRYGDLPARFAAIVVQRSPMAALVPVDSPLKVPTDLTGARLGGPADGGLVLEYQASLDELGIGPSELVDMGYSDAWAALARGEVDAVADYVDIIPRLRRQAGIPVRAIPFGIDVYSSGLVAADRLTEDRVMEMGAAVIAALERQRRQPEEGLAALAQRYPDTDPAAAQEGWSLAAPNIFTDVSTGSMDVDGWNRTLRFVARAHSVPSPPPQTVYRPELAGLPS